MTESSVKMAAPRILAVVVDGVSVDAWNGSQHVPDRKVQNPRRRPLCKSTLKMETLYF
jgi:hypothetical protein